MKEQELRQLFKNLSDEDKTVRTDGAPHNSMNKYESIRTIKLMSEDRFIETLKEAKLLIIPDASVQLPVSEIEKLLNQYKKECLLNAEAPFHHEAEGWATIKFFIQWLKAKGN